MRFNRRILVSVLLGVVSVVASVPLISYWPRTHYPYRSQVDRDRRPEAGEGRGYLSLRLDSGPGYTIATGWASQQMVFGGYNYATNTNAVPWSARTERTVAPWLSGLEPWPGDGISRQVQLLSVGWPLAAAEGRIDRTNSRPRRDPGPPGGPRGFPPEDTSTEVAAGWSPTRQLWTSYGGWAYIKSPTWLKTSRLGKLLFDKSMLPAVPTRPLWFGIAVNGLLFSGAWWLLVTFISGAHRAWRNARTAGRCPHCRYPRAGLEPDAPCPECGKRPGRDSNPRPAV